MLWLRQVYKVALVALATLVLSSCEQSASKAAVLSKTDLSTQQLADFFEACARGNEVQVRTALDSDPSLVNAQTRATKDTPLKRATEFKQLAIVNLLLSRGAKPDIADYHGNTPLIAASYQGDDQIAAALLEAGANPNAIEEIYGYTPLINAAWKGNANVVVKLLAAGADKSIKAKDGRTALVRAQQAGQSEVVRLLGAAQ
jgi:uncharacterized protein